MKKFRVWDKVNKRFSTGNHCLNTEGMLVSDTDPHGVQMDGSTKYWFNKQYEFAGFDTGLTDKNGTELFGGDIFNQGDVNIKYQVIFKDACFMGNQIGNKSSAGLLHFLSDIEVIGNIHENPELLKKR